jgi:hypothetical protein
MKRLASLIALVVLILAPQTARAFAVAPGILELSAERGEVVKSNIAYINNEGVAKTTYLSVIKFVPSDTGAPRFIPYEDDHAGLPQWVVLPTQHLVVPARSKIDVPLTIAVPKDATSGGHYAAVVFSDAPSDIVATNGAQVSAKMAVLVLLTVAGENIQRAGLLDFTSPQSGRLMSVAGGEYQYRLQNQGNVHLLPTGTIQVKDLFGRVITEVNANPSAGRVLPASTRTFTGLFGDQPSSFLEILRAQWSQLAIGPATVELNLAYGANQSLLASFHIWLLPWQLLLTAFLVVLILVLAVKGLFSGRKTN